jgi:hypothetical protein
MNWTANLVPLAPFIMIIFIIWFVSLTRRAQDRHRAEMQKDLLAKFSSASELTEFLKTDGGKLLMPAPIRGRTPANRAGAGVIVVVVGIGMMAGSRFSTDPDAMGILRIAALIAIATGIGLLISAFVTQKLAQKWREQDKQVQ